MPPPPITGTILSMAHASGNKWVDEVSGVKWLCSDIESPYSTNQNYQIKNDRGSRLKGKLYIELQEGSRLYTTTLSG